MRKMAEEYDNYDYAQGEYAPTQQMPNQIYPPHIAGQIKADLIDKIKPEVMVEIIRNRLLGRELTNQGWIDVPALRDRRLTEVGAWEIANLMLGVSSINVSISKLDNTEIKKRLKSIARSAQLMLVANWQKYGLKNTAQQYYVHEIVFSNTLAVLKQADTASIQELLKGTIHEARSYGSGEQKETFSKKVGRVLGLS